MSETTNPEAAETAALLSRAAQLSRAGQQQQAMLVLQQVVDRDPGNYPALTGLAQFAMAAGRSDIAEHFAERGHNADPRGFECLAILAQCYQAKRRFRDAIRIMRQAAGVQPDNDRVQFNLGVLHEQSGDWSAARKAYENAVALNGDNQEARANLAMCQLADRESEAALAGFDALRDMRRGPVGAADPDGLPELPETENVLSRFMLRMQREQLAALDARGLLANGLKDLVPALDRALDDLGEGDDDEVFHRRHPRHHWKPHWQLIERHHNRTLYLPDAALPAGPVINPRLDAAAIDMAWRAATPQHVVVDDFLAPDVLAALQDFCRDATIWYDLRKNYLGAYLTDGFANPLTIGIAHALADALPGIFGELPLTQAWGYKYGPKLTGIGMHADAALVNCNFWIAPDEANTNPETGGLLIYRKAAPLDWDFNTFNNDTDAMLQHLGDAVNDPVRIPHRCNRIAIFNSNLFHRTDDIAFRDAFEARRYNVTLLYGKRYQADSGENP
ncbi:MAG: tetratricopeptide repeat protein [Pseudomonadota bacterium]